MKRITLLLVLCLASCTPSPPTPKPRPAPPYDAGLRDGAVVFIRGGLLVGPIHRQTDSTLTHAAIVLFRDGRPWVYEATTPAVQKTPWGEYVAKLEAHRQQLFFEKRDFDWFMIQPQSVYTPYALNAMKWHAESQLGRPYMLRGLWKGREVRGIFCSQFVADVIEKSGKIVSAHWRESPGSLYQKLLPLYEAIP